MNVRIISTTHWMGADGQSLQRLPAGLALEVEDDTAKRWLRNKIAEPWDGPLGQVNDDEVGASAEDFDAEIARLTALRDAAAQRARDQNTVQDTPQKADYGDGLADYDFLSEAQKTALRRQGFTDADRIASARDEELLEVAGIGQATVDKLRAV